MGSSTARRTKGSRLVSFLSAGIFLGMVLNFCAHFQIVTEMDQRPWPAAVPPAQSGVRAPTKATRKENVRLAAGRDVGSHEEGVSACLLVNDENPRLPEWLAYHYTILPLRSLIIAIDPASRSSPNDILLSFYQELNIDVHPWGEKKYLHPKMRGPCPTPEDHEKCLWHHRDRQQYFIMKCMSEFKRQGKSWVALLDVDEYLIFNRVRGDDPPIPLDEPPRGVPTMEDWKFHDSKIPQRAVQKFYAGVVTGTVNGSFVKSDFIFVTKDANIDYGSVVSDAQSHRYFLRDDRAYHESTALDQAPPGVPTVKEPFLAGTDLYIRIYNDTYGNNPDGTFMSLPMGWEIGDEKMRTTFHKGHIITDEKGRKYYLENEARLWPPHYSSKDILPARRRLPEVHDNRTILDVLNHEAGEGYARGRGLGPCLSVPRVLYGSREDRGPDPKWAPDGLEGSRFVTLRYSWHSSKGEFESGRYGKTLIDVSRIPARDLEGKALNIHRPLPYHCRNEVRYALSLFRVNHYLDSFEAYSYRNDARSNLRQCRECYEKKGSSAAVARDDDIKPWLHRFVKEVGKERARRLLAHVGEFIELA